HVLFIGRLIKARPTGARIEFGIGTEQFGPTAGASIRTLVLGFPVLSGECRLGSLFSGYLILVGGELLLPFRLGFFDFLTHLCKIYRFFTAIATILYIAFEGGAQNVGHGGRFIQVDTDSRRNLV